MDKGLELTAEQWSTVRKAYKRAEAIEATLRARAEEVVVQDEEEDSAMEISSGEESDSAMIGDLDELESGAARLSFLPEDPILVEQGLRNFQREVDRCREWDARRRTD
jgi:hypothetical protein